LRGTGLRQRRGSSRSTDRNRGQPDQRLRTPQQRPGRRGRAEHPLPQPAPQPARRRLRSHRRLHPRRGRGRSHPCRRSRLPAERHRAPRRSQPGPRRLQSERPSPRNPRTVRLHRTRTPRRPDYGAALPGLRTDTAVEFLIDRLPLYLSGAGTTLLITLLGAVLAFALAMVVGVMGTLRNPVARAIATGYTETFRGVAALVLMY